MSRTAFQIHNDADYQRALTLLDELWEAEPGSLEERVLDIMATRIAAYEAALRASEWSEAGSPAKGVSPTMHLCKVVLNPDGTLSLQNAEDEDINFIFADPHQKLLVDIHKGYAWEFLRQAQKLREALSHLRKLVRKVDAGEMDLKDVVAMLDRTSNNIIDLEAIDDSPQVLPMPESKIPE